MPLTVDEIARLLRVRGSQPCGREAVTPLEHALQCAQLAEQAGETPHTVVAALLHDLGHLLLPRDEWHVGGDLHQHVAIPFLRGLLPDEVLEPIRLHVDAKRCLCCTEAGYWASLTPASKRSLELQGGAMLFAQAQAFWVQPHAEVALRLRRYDDRAKVPGLDTPPLAHYLAMLADVTLASDRRLSERLLAVCD